MSDFISREAVMDRVDEIVKTNHLRPDYVWFTPNGVKVLAQEIPAANAIEKLSRQRDRAYARLCEWCGVCPEGKRNPEDCEIAALNPEPPKEEAPAGPYDLLYEEGGPDA